MIGRENCGFPGSKSGIWGTRQLLQVLARLRSFVVFVFHGFAFPREWEPRSSRYDATAKTTTIPVATASAAIRKNPMMSPLDTASSLLWWSNVLYVVGALLTLGTSAMVLFEKRQAGKGIEVKHSVRNEVFFVSSALICLAGTCGAIYFSSKVSNIKDADLAAYKVSAGLQIAQANNAAEQAKAVAATASNNVAGANKKAAEANSTAQLAVLDKTKILHDNLALQQKIEAEQSARVVIENKIAPRTLAPGQQQNIMYALWA